MLTALLIFFKEGYMVSSDQIFNIEQLKSMLALMPNPIALNRAPLNGAEGFDEIVHVNPAFEQSLGYCADDIPTHKEWFEKVYPDLSYKAYVMQEWSKSLQEATLHNRTLLGFTCKVCCKDETYKWFQVTAQINSKIFGDYYLIIFLEINSPDQAMVNLQTLTNELIENNQQLERSKNTLSDVQKLAKVGSWEMDLTDGSVNWSLEMCRMYQEDPATFVPSTEDFLSRLSPEDASLVEQKMQEIMEGSDQRVVVSPRRKDGSSFTVEIYGHVICDKHGQPVKMVGSTMDITRRVALQNENDELAKLIRVAQHELYIVDFETDQFVYVNESASRNTGYSVEELLGFSVYDINPQLSPEIVQQMKLVGQDLDKMHNTSVHQRKDGSTYPVHATLQRVTYKTRLCYAIFDIDITELKQNEQALDDQLKLLENIIDTVPVRIFWKDLDGAYLGANKLFLQDANLQSRDELVGKTDWQLPWANINAESFQKDDLEVMESGLAKLNFEEIQTHADGKTIVLSTSKVPFLNTKNEMIGVLGTYQDITYTHQMQKEILNQQEALHHQANHDLLTKLPNRLLLQDRLLQASRLANRHGSSFALLFIDLDQFKQINDAMGHHVGDQVLQEMAIRLRAEIRESDTLARIGGDEFTILMEEISSTQDVVTLAQKIIDVAKAPIVVQDQEFYLSSSIGISLYPKDTTSIDSLLKFADAAMYRAKDYGRNNFQFYTEDMTQMAFEHVAMQASLRQAINNDEFVVAYQPQVNAHNKKITGLEALVRWNHPLKGLVQPNSFIPLAEATGMIVELDRLVMRRAMLQCARWYQEGLNIGVLSLNLSVKQVQKADFIDFLIHTLKETKCKPDWLCLEVTESAVMTNLDKMKAELEQIRALGIRIAIDDFGTGYSSLAYLKRLPVSKLKIDRTFISDLPDDEEDATITRTIIMMARNLGLEVIAEGVETQAQEAFLLENDCPEIQGYYYSPPLLKEALKLWLIEFNKLTQQERVT